MKVINSSKGAIHLLHSHARRFILSMMEQVAPGENWHPDSHGSFIVVESDDHPIDDFQFIGRQGLLSDLFDDSEIGDDGFATPFEWAFHHPQFELYELYRQNNDETATVFLIPEGYVESHADVKRLIEEYLAVRTGGVTDGTTETIRRKV